MLGHLGTSGADYMDYIAADRVLIPPELSDFYSEKVRLSYMHTTYIDNHTTDKKNTHMSVMLCFN